MYFSHEDDCYKPLFLSCDFRLTFLSILLIFPKFLHDGPKRGQILLYAKATLDLVILFELEK